jgi:DNA-binding GntR family transcriptional regulator
VPIDAAAPPAHAHVTSPAVSLTQAPADIAHLLQLPDVTAPVIVRYRVCTDAQGIPTEQRISYLPADVAESTPLMSPVPIAAPWDQALAAHARRTPTSASVSAYARRPADSEAAALGLSPAATVLVRDTVTYDLSGVPVDVTRSVWPAESTTLGHDYPLPR